MSVLELGYVTSPSGVLLLIDTGFLNMWSHDRVPVMPDGILSSQEATDRANTFVDLAIVGKDAVKAGRLLAWHWDPRYAFDQAPEKGKIWQALEEIVAKNGLDARFEVLPARIPHRTRTISAMEFGDGAGEMFFQGATAVAVNDIPTGVPLRVHGTMEPEYERWDMITIECRPGVVASTQHVGHVWVDQARILIADLNALGEWKHEESVDGLADYLFWGADAPKVASAFEAPLVTASQYGWLDLPFDDALDRGFAVEDYQEEHKLRFAGDFRPHSHHWHVLKETRASETHSGSIDVGGATMLNFFTLWGDGSYDVYRDFDAAGSLVRIRIDLATSAKPKLKAMMERMKSES